MEFGIRELVQFGTLLASLAGAFAVVKSQLARVIQDIKTMNMEIHELNTRLDKAESSTAVFTHQISVLGAILSPDKLADQHREIASMRSSLDSLTSEVSTLRHMHNGSHPPV
tara:strand:+ start:1343 stop:1678 length:336 start_codon:yes stop_codon:yes gene_type:complete